MTRKHRLVFWLAGIVVSCSLAGGAKAMTTRELVEELKKVQAGETGLVEKFPVKIEETSPGFLGGATYLQVTVLHPNRPHVLHYVHRPERGIYRLKLGQPELDRMQTELQLEITDEETALSYAQWLLRVTQGPAYWPVSSVDDVPFLPAGENETELRERIARVKLLLPEKIAPPTVEPLRDAFRVRQTAVKDRDLVRYDVTVTLLGRAEIKQKTIEPKLPVVYVLG